MTLPITPCLGFEVLKLSENVRMKLNRAGQDGRISLAKACIWSGLQHSEQIIDKAQSIGGEHLRVAFETVLMEGENIHWRKCADGSLQLID
ncbi:hypothetical protein [Tsuneonella troitsensis]|uniref:hypothetical protein n=1 Tax=Tsuneonella troitsensis TaxID=292222 RepID=UPI00128F264E|nr:hypothetical protein [Tsuneonella troitsensis]